MDRAFFPARFTKADCSIFSCSLCATRAAADLPFDLATDGVRSRTMTRCLPFASMRAGSTVAAPMPWPSSGFGNFSCSTEAGSCCSASVQQLPALVNSLQTLSYRLQELQEVRRLPQSSYLATALKTDMLAWRENVLDIMQQLSSDPTYSKRLERSHLNNYLARIEDRIEQCLDGDVEKKLGSADQQNFYRLLGVYRGTSEALLDFAQQVAKVDWTPCYQERFT